MGSALSGEVVVTIAFFVVMAVCSFVQVRQNEKEYAVEDETMGVGNSSDSVLGIS